MFRAMIPKVFDHTVEGEALWESFANTGTLSHRRHLGIITRWAVFVVKMIKIKRIFRESPR